MIKHFIREHTRYGGLPLVVLNKDEESRKRVFIEYLDLVVYMDIIERQGVKNLPLAIIANTFRIEYALLLLLPAWKHEHGTVIL